MKTLTTPFCIGSVTIPNRIVLGPMAGLTNSAYRRHMKTHGAGLVTTGMVSAHGLLYGNVRTREFLAFAEEERPVAVQLFASDPAAMAAAAEAVLSQPRPPDILDINMGCPVRKVVRTGAGSALLGDPDKAVAVASAVVGVAAQAGVPVTVKLRSGLKEGDRIAVEIAQRLEAAGVLGLCVHPRAANQFYHGAADHSITADVVKAVGIPVIASGDILSVAATLAVLEATGAAAVMVARGVAGNPWLVDALVAAEPSSGSACGAAAYPDARPPLDVVVDDLRRLLALAAEDLGGGRAARWSRKLLGWYLRPAGIPAAVVESLRKLPDTEALDAELVALKDEVRRFAGGQH
jgi:tRNA-dihydrouridine synthase B